MKSKSSNAWENAVIILVITLMVSIFYYIISDSFSIFLSQSNPFIALALSILLNPSYIIIILWLTHQYGLKGVASALLITIAIDIISLTHSINIAGIMPSSADAIPLYGYADTLFFPFLNSFLPGNLATFILYIVIPFLLVFCALLIIGKPNSFVKIFKQAV